VQDNERVFPSTTFAWKRVKVRRRPGPQGTARAQRAPSAESSTTARSAARSAREPFTVQMRYRGGAGVWWEVVYAGKTHRFDGGWCFHDVMRQLLNLEDL
jgi:hypothetical protein